VSEKSPINSQVTPTSHWGSWVNCVLLLWGPIIAVSFVHGLLGIFLKVLVSFFSYTIVNSLSKSHGTKYFVAPATTGSIILGISLWLNLSPTFVKIAIILTLLIFISTPSYIRKAESEE